MKKVNDRQKYTVDLANDLAKLNNHITSSSIYNVLLLVGIAVLLVVSSLYIEHQLLQTEDLTKLPPATPQAIATTTALEKEEVVLIDPFLNVEIEANAAYVYDVRTGEVLFAKEENTRLPLASLTKVMTALVAAENQSGVSGIVTVTPDDIKQEGNSGLLINEKWDLKDLLAYTLITSSNDGASAIAAAVGSQWKVDIERKKEAKEFPEANKDLPVAASSTYASSTPSIDTDISEVGSSIMADNALDYHDTSLNYERSAKDFFIEQMNNTAKSLGLSDTEFYNESGLDISYDKSGAYGTAKEVAIIMEYIIENYPEILSTTTYVNKEFTSAHDVLHNATNTNLFVSTMPGLLASKTGYTDLAGGNLGIVFDSSIGTPVIIVVLGSTIDGRFADVQKLIDASIEKVAQGSHI